MTLEYKFTKTRAFPSDELTDKYLSEMTKWFVNNEKYKPVSEIIRVAIRKYGISLVGNITIEDIKKAAEKEPI